MITNRDRSQIILANEALCVTGIDKPEQLNFTPHKSEESYSLKEAETHQNQMMMMNYGN